MSAQLAAGPRATISAGDFSGVGAGLNGESWDYETCTLLVERIETSDWAPGIYLVNIAQGDHKAVVRLAIQ